LGGVVVARRDRRTAQQHGGVVMMGYGNGGSWIWMALGVIVLLVLIGVVVWVLIAVNNRAHHGHAPDASGGAGS
jgi:uncharacterized membrane protein